MQSTWLDARVCTWPRRSSLSTVYACCSTIAVMSTFRSATSLAVSRCFQCCNNADCYLMLHNVSVLHAKGKGKGTDIGHSASYWKLTSEALRYDTRCQGMSPFYIAHSRVYPRMKRNITLSCIWLTELIAIFWILLP